MAWATWTVTLAPSFGNCEAACSSDRGSFVRGLTGCRDGERELAYTGNLAYSYCYRQMARRGLQIPECELNVEMEPDRGPAGIPCCAWDLGHVHGRLGGQIRQNNA